MHAGSVRMSKRVKRGEGKDGCHTLFKKKIFFFSLLFFLKFFIFIYIYIYIYEAVTRQSCAGYCDQISSGKNTTRLL